jgi:inosine-uridine nucleoside N-ribohydrolase
MPSSLAVLPLLLPLLLLLARPASPASPVKLIIDTDIGGGGCNDVDDVGAICIANALADNGEAEILAIVQNTQPPECTGTISVLNQHYGRASVPIGAYQKQDGVPPGAPGVNPPLRPCRPLPYVPELTNNFPSPIKNTSQVPSSVAVYRSTLAAQPDHSVAISSIGLSTNLAALLRSGPDRHSPLAGPELIAKKVKLLAVMGGKYPTSCPGGKCGCECNFCAVYNDGGQDHVVASAASAFTFANWPREVKILFSGFTSACRCTRVGR